MDAERLTLIAWFYLLCGVVIAIPLIDYIRGKVELVSFRNLFLGGMFWFQLYNAIPVIKNPIAASYSVQQIVPTATIFAFWNTLFIATFLTTYQSGFLAPAASRQVPLPKTEASRSTFYFLIPCVLVIAFLLKTVSIPYLGFVTGTLALSLAALAAGAGAWLWGPRLLNPVTAAYSLITFAGAAYITGIGEFSRRPLLSAVLGFCTGMYYSRLRYLKPSQALPLIAAVGLAGVTVVGLHTIGGRNIAGGIQNLSSGQLGDAFESVTEEYGTPRHALWLVESAQVEGREFEEIPFLLTVKYIFLLPVPRDLWSGKPFPVSTYTADWSGRQGVKLGRGGVTSPVGIVGNAAVEGGIVAVLVYGIFFGLLIRFFDSLFQRTFDRSLILLGVGSTLGQVFAVPRGETAIMTFNFIVGTTTATMVSVVLVRMLGKLFPAAQHDPNEDDLYDEDPYRDNGYDDYSDYGDDSYSENSYSDDADADPTTDEEPGTTHRRDGHGTHGRHEPGTPEA